MPGATDDPEDRDAQDARDAKFIAAGAYGELLASYFPRIFQILRLKRMSRDDAEEVRQRVVEHLLVELRDGKKYTTPFRVVVHQRTKWKRFDFFAEKKRQPGELAEDPAEEGPDALADAESEIAFEHLIAGLPPRERQVVELRWGHGLEAQEIGEMLGIEANAVHQALFRAHAKLRKVDAENE